MTADWNRVKDLFDEALRVPAAERDSFLAVRAGDPATLEEVRSLLAVYYESPDFLEAPPLAGRCLGPWRLVREIGRGGMGVVWEAHRADREYDRRVAVKLLPAGLLSASDVARFREERQILARLAHPGIAGLLDGGTAADGSPYLVLEYVEGERLDDWVEDRALPLRDRLKLFLAVCAAVEYAHRHLVIHRDLKPANILVTAEGVPKLLDFGIAKFLDGGAAGQTATARRLTPEYASPEQIRGDAASTASDVYSLGVLLYRLVTGRGPYAVESGDPLEMLRAICEQEPQPPSAVDGELGAIVLQALRKNPEERYASVRALADDLNAWLDHRPVAAHHPSWWQKSLKYVRRNRIPSAAAAAVLLSIFAGSGVSVWYARDAGRERQRAERRFDQVRELAHAVLFELHDAIRELPGSTRARQILVERALHYLRELEATAPENREVALELAAAYARIGEVQGNLGGGHLGDTVAAIESETRARRLAQDVLRSNPGDADAERILADAGERLARLLAYQGDRRQVDALWREAMAIRQKEAARQPGAPGPAGKAHAMVARGLALKGDWMGALGEYEKAAAAYRNALAGEPRNPQNAARLTDVYHSLAACWKEMRVLPQALACYRQAQRLDEARVAAEPGATSPQIDLSFDLVEAGWVEHSLGRHRQAIADYEQSLAIQERLSAADPEDVWMKIEAAKLLNTAAPAYEAAGDRAGAVRALETSAARLEASLAHDPANADVRMHVGWVLSRLGEVYSRGKEWAKAAAAYEKAIDTLGLVKYEAQPGLDLRPGPMLDHARKRLAEARSRL